MRLVTWNTCRGPAEHKLHLVVDRLHPDVVALQEIAKPEGSDVTDCCWSGSNKNQGVLVWVRKPLQLRSEDLGCETELYQLVRVEKNGHRIMDLFNLWVKPYAARPSGECPYGYSLVTALKSGLRHTRRARRVFMGDSNILNPASKQWYMSWLKRRGLISAYHCYFDERPGEETRPTHHHRTRKTAHHIDWCFIPEYGYPFCQRVSIGTRAQWDQFSDHLPIVVDIADKFFIEAGGRS